MCTSHEHGNGARATRALFKLVAGVTPAVVADTTRPRGPRHPLRVLGRGAAPKHLRLTYLFPLRSGHSFRFTDLDPFVHPKVACYQGVQVHDGKFQLEFLNRVCAGPL